VEYLRRGRARFENVRWIVDPSWSEISTGFTKTYSSEHKRPPTSSKARVSDSLEPFEIH